MWLALAAQLRLGMDFLDAALDHARPASVGGASIGEDATLLERMKRAFVQKSAERSAELRLSLDEQEAALSALSREFAANGGEPPDDWRPDGWEQGPEAALAEGEDAVGGEEEGEEGSDEEDSAEMLSRCLNQPRWVM